MAHIGKLPAIRQEIWVKASAARVWKALTGSRQLLRWFTVGEKLELRKGGRWDFAGFPGTVLEVAKGTRLVHTHTGPDKSVSRIVYCLERSGKYCRLTLTHDRFGKGKCTRDAWVGAWPFLLSNLKTYIETGSPMWETPFRSSKE